MIELIGWLRKQLKLELKRSFLFVVELKEKINFDRIKRISISALKQCGQAYLPKINDLKDFKFVIESIEANQKYIAHLEEDDKVYLSKTYKSGESSVILIGPEGDFTKDEINIAKTNHFIPVTLGKNT